MSEKIICICDFCGKPINDDKFKIRISKNGRKFDKPEIKKLVYHGKCVDKIISTLIDREKKSAENFNNIISSQSTMKEIQESSTPVIKRGRPSKHSDEKVDEEKRNKNIEEIKKDENKSSIDIGKIYALHKAGWNCNAIAKEMDISVENIKNIILSEQRSEQGLGGV